MPPEIMRATYARRPLEMPVCSNRVKESGTSLSSEARKRFHQQKSTTQTKTGKNRLQQNESDSA